MQTKNLKADKPIYNGLIKFDGDIKIRTVRQEEKTLHTDMGGMTLQHADPNKEIMLLVRKNVGWNEINTGYIVRTKKNDNADPPRFGLKAAPDDSSWFIYEYRDVIAWGYADGGLNKPNLFRSCQRTIEEEFD